MQDGTCTPRRWGRPSDRGVGGQAETGRAAAVSGSGTDYGPARHLDLQARRDAAHRLARRGNRPAFGRRRPAPRPLVRREAERVSRAQRVRPLARLGRGNRAKRHAVPPRTDLLRSAQGTPHHVHPRPDRHVPAFSRPEGPGVLQEHQAEVFRLANEMLPRTVIDSEKGAILLAGLRSSSRWAARRDSSSRLPY